MEKSPIKSGFFRDISFLHILYGGECWTRTSDLLRVKQAL